MKLATAGVVTFALVAAGGTGALLLRFLARDDDAAAEVAALRGELAQSRREQAALRDRLDALAGELRTLRDTDAPSVTRAPALGPKVPERAAAADHGAASGAAAFDPHELLAQYVGSFADGGHGSDFFRMAVAAYAWPLRRELQEIVTDRDQPDALRLQVLAMLDGGSFRGDAGTIDALLEVARQGGWEEGAAAALAALGRIGDGRTAQLVEELAAALPSLRLRKEAWSALGALLGAEVDAVLLRLFEREPTSDGRIALLAYFRNGERAATLRAFDLASRDETVVRFEAAGRIGRFRNTDFVALTEEWLARELDEPTRERLRAALGQQKEIPAWSELQACGAPDVENPANDDRHAWASAQPDGGVEWLELAFVPQVADRVTIHETCVAGAITRVEVLEVGGAWRPVFSGADPTAAPGPFEVRFAVSAAAIAKVRLTLDTKKKPGWSEIDAVELRGPDGRAWAKSATASSRYGEGRESTADAFGDALRNFKAR